MASEQRRDESGKFEATHGGKRTPEYKSWAGIIQRCTNPKNKNWARYGGRGIRVCDEWLSFESFIRDMGRKPGPRYSIDRVNNDGNYEPGNSRWETMSSQCRNRVKRPGSSAHRGVCMTASGRWRAQTGTGANRAHLGTFDTEAEAAAELARREALRG